MRRRGYRTIINTTGPYVQYTLFSNPVDRLKPRDVVTRRDLINNFQVLGWPSPKPRCLPGDYSKCRAQHEVGGRRGGGDVVMKRICICMANSCRPSPFYSFDPCATAQDTRWLHEAFLRAPTDRRTASQVSQANQIKANANYPILFSSLISMWLQKRNRGFPPTKIIRYHTALPRFNTTKPTTTCAY